MIYTQDVQYKEVEINIDSIPKIYSYIKQGFSNAYKIFRQDITLSIPDIQAVLKDFERISNEFIEKSKGSFVLIPQESHTEIDESTQEQVVVIDQEQVLFDPIRLDITYNSIEKGLLDVPTVCRDIVTNYPTYKATRTFTEFKELLKQE